ncbi:hypothetical protein GTU79_19530 [Sodalis ligni]|uniref:hypothetical protein n=1 Tax=Sodalis ligni TaxID=2697027 RepID=UPI001BDEB118|nr:hypothetical protein [Sodalis ligni]QWA09534.1 hypothetical protein GTU79_19530 [Sodalis ligni]
MKSTASGRFLLLTKRGNHEEIKTAINANAAVQLRPYRAATRPRTGDEVHQKLTGEEFDFSGYDGFELERGAKDRRTIMLGVFNGSAATLAHEASHVAFEICSIVGLPTPNDQTNETFCYLVQRIVERFLPLIKAKHGR